ncbi:MAG TPA: hypothetical protein VHD76_07150 [Bryobacteraceae bacterium]|nr:hypothetical protein [Bryobacteraceae bacterium]
MSRVRVPKAAAPLLIYCKTNAQKRADACFGSYAELLMFAAAVGFQRYQGKPPGDRIEFFDASPDPIDLAIFKNQHLFPQLLLMGLASTGSHAIARNEEGLCALLERFATAGSQHLAQTLISSTPDSFIFTVAHMIVQQK